MTNVITINGGAYVEIEAKEDLAGLGLGGVVGWAERAVVNRACAGEAAGELGIDEEVEAASGATSGGGVAGATAVGLRDAVAHRAGKKRGGAGRVGAGEHDAMATADALGGGDFGMRVGGAGIGFSGGDAFADDAVVIGKHGDFLAKHGVGAAGVTPWAIRRAI